ncbi:energy transducer TonB [Paraburkholderia sp. ZP32-5]|uniref:energy transducer TonB n=1 Tax=Paraburkholderia sp. ZP32-5 TaxID=2883245 RepID=UPI001F3BEF4F|nr:energy transducer TonB [Paraburkholderia sp. ZP32-5]
MANRANAMHAATGYRRAGIVLGAVIAAHLALLALMLVARDRTIERIVEPRTITALLLSPEPAPATPAPAPVAAPPTPAPRAAVIPPTPPAARPPVRVKPAPPRPHVARSEPTPAPVPAPESTAQPTAAPPVSAPAAAPAAAPSTTPAPAVQAAAPASTEPRNVSHVDCSIPKPDYPDISKRRRENGTAVVRFVVGLTGRIETAQLQKSSGYDRLNDAALAAVQAGTCRPYRENGTAVRAAYSQSFVFGLSE